MITRAGFSTYKILFSLASSHQLESSRLLAFSSQPRIPPRDPVPGKGGGVREGGLEE